VRTRFLNNYESLSPARGSPDQPRAAGLREHARQDARPAWILLDSGIAEA